MPKYYCDYCDTFLTHDSPSVRKTHNGGRKHKDNVRGYYQKWMEDQAQKLVDATAKAFANAPRPMGPPQMGMMGRPMVPPMGVGRPPMGFPGYGAMPGYGGMPMGLNPAAMRPPGGPPGPGGFRPPPGAVPPRF